MAIGGLNTLLAAGGDWKIREKNTKNSKTELTKA
jgi:hypothetical protein